MYFLENELAGGVSFKQEDGYWQMTDGAINQTIVQAIRDATQTANPVLQQKAISWLLICCPDIAEQIELPEELHFDTVPTLATAYVTH